MQFFTIMNWATDIMCRVCLKSEFDQRGYVSLFTNHNNSIICDNICTIANIKVKSDDGLPDKICYDCLTDLETAIHFKAKCEQSDKLLRATPLNNQNPVESLYNLTEGSNNIKKEDLKVEIEEYLDEDYLTEDINTNVVKQTNDLTQNELKCNIHQILVKNNEENFEKKRRDLKLECNECGNFFKSKCKMRVHWKKTHFYQALICHICKRTFKSYKALNRHKKIPPKSCITASKINVEGAGRSRIFHCKNCSYTTCKSKDMNSHLTTHTGDRPFVCDVCQKGFTQQSSLSAHKESHGIYTIESTCQYCGIYLKGRGRIYSHLRLHMPHNFQCDYCKKMLKTRNSLISHLKRHSGVKSYTCDQCAKTFYTISELGNHRRLIHEKGKHIYKCDRCEYTAYKSRILKKHKERHTDTNIPCLVCGKFFINIDTFTVHQAKHLAERKYLCPQCTKSFLNSSSLDNHIRNVHKCTRLYEKSVDTKLCDSPSISVNKGKTLITINLQ